MNPARARATVLVAALLGVLLATAGLLAPAAHAADPPPSIDAESAIVVNAASGRALFDDDADSRRPIASTTKLMTALVARRHLALDDVIAAPKYDAAPVESQIDLRAGEKLRVADLLRALLVESANDAAVDLAVGASGSRADFVKEMNARARRLGLRDTHFANPIGLDDPENYSTARDLAKLAGVVLKDPFLRRIVDDERVTLKSGDSRRTLRNRNGLVGRYPWIDGVKTGHTQKAGYILIGAGTRKGVSVISVVLDEPSEARREQDSLALLRWGAKQLKAVDPVRRGRAVARVAVRHGDAPVALAAERSVRRTVRTDAKVSTRVLGVPREVEGPLPRGAAVGRIRVSAGDRVLATVALRTRAAVPEPSLLDRAADELPSWPVLVVALLALAAVVQGGLMERRRRRRIRKRPRRRRRETAA